MHGELLTLGVKVAAFSAASRYPHELDHGTLGADLPPRTAGPDIDLQPAAAAPRATGEYEEFYNLHRPHQGLANAWPRAPLPEPITDPHRLAQLNIQRRDRLGGILHEYEHAA
jgi:hypothetical protein